MISFSTCQNCGWVVCTESNYCSNCGTSLGISISVRDGAIIDWKHRLTLMEEKLARLDKFIELGEKK